MKIATIYTPATISVVRCVELGVSESFASRANTAKVWSGYPFRDGMGVACRVSCVVRRGVGVEEEEAVEYR